jgi:hypothetical protein
MDDQRFDQWVRGLGQQRLPRRRVLGVLSAGLTALIGVAPWEVAARPHRARRAKQARTIIRGGCRIREQGRSWRLLANCTATGRIRLPKGTSFNGQHRLIRVTGDLGKFDGALISANGGRLIIQNLRIQGEQPGGTCKGFGDFRAISMGASGAIRNVTIDGLQGARPFVDEWGTPCVAGITVWGDHRRSPAVTLAATRLTNVDGRGIEAWDVGAFTLDRIEVDLRSRVAASAVVVQHSGSATVKGSTIVGGGVFFTYVVQVRVDNSGLRDALLAFAASPDTWMTGSTLSGAGVRLQGAVATLVGNQLTASTGVLAIDGAALTLAGNTITAPPAGDHPAGVSFQSGSGGRVSANTISGYRCGIFRSFNAGPVTVDPDNDLTGNDDEVC